ncbi:MAG TPA: heavy metal-associated domain-containing protein [Thermoanaerobaculia bacterium]|nr:heavy metal-associated domain-containing protein [Thermoanaerobaculia bacterium]
MNLTVFVPRMRNLKHSIIVLAAVLLVAVPTLAASQQTLILIKGMHCSGCASGIQTMLKRVEGVSKASGVVLWEMGGVHVAGNVRPGSSYGVK